MSTCFGQAAVLQISVDVQVKDQALVITEKESALRADDMQLRFQKMEQELASMREANRQRAMKESEAIMESEETKAKTTGLG